MDNKYYAEDPDLYVNMLFEDKKPEGLDYEGALKRSTTGTAIKYEKKTTKKPTGFKEIILTAVILATIALSAKAGIALHEQKENREAFYKGKEILATVVDNHTIENKEDLVHRYWWYDLHKMAQDLVDVDNGFDINTKVYGCYKNFNEYKRLQHMDELFWEINYIVNEHPERYDEETLEIASYHSFTEYLEAKNLTLDEYDTLMKEIVTAYGKSLNNEQEIQELLGKLKGVSR